MKDKIEQAAIEYSEEKYEGQFSMVITSFKAGAEWSDAHPKNSWISVKDRLPEPEQEVLLYDKDSIKHYEIGWLRKKKGYCKSKWFVTNGYVTDESITYWMPIPKFGGCGYSEKMNDQKADTDKICGNCDVYHACGLEPDPVKHDDPACEYFDNSVLSQFNKKSNETKTS